MEKDINQFYYEQELVALIKSGVSPEEAKKIADSHIANGSYSEASKQVSKERKEDEELQGYARILSARIKSGEKPQYVVEDMAEHER